MDVDEQCEGVRQVLEDVARNDEVLSPVTESAQTLCIEVRHVVRRREAGAPTELGEEGLVVGRCPPIDEPDCHTGRDWERNVTRPDLDALAGETGCETATDRERVDRSGGAPQLAQALFFCTVLARIPRVARSAPSEITGKIPASFQVGSIEDQS